MSHFYERNGFCSICEQKVMFFSDQEWYRDHLFCNNCRSVVRERALSLVLEDIAKNWRDLDIHESSSAGRGVSLKMAQGAKNYTSSQFYPNAAPGSNIDGFRNENLEKQTFDDECFDIVVTLDVMEHVFNPEAVYKEVFRTLKPGGIYLHTFPIYKNYIDATLVAASQAPDGSVQHHMEPEYHGNPVDDKGSLVTHYYGYDIAKQISVWSSFNVEIRRYWRPDLGIIGEFTEVVICWKPSA